MPYGLVQTSAPATEPVTTAEAKLWCKVDDDITEDNDLIDSLVASARFQVEEYTQRQLVTATWRLTLEKFPPGNVIYLPKPNVQSVSSVKYYNTANTQTTLTANTDYEVDVYAEPARIQPYYGTVWPSTRDRFQAVEVIYVAGYGAASAVPSGITTAIKLLVSHWYANREAVVLGTIATDLPLAVKALLDMYVVGNVGGNKW